MGKTRWESSLTTWGEGPYRIVFSCEDLDATEALLKGNGVEGVERCGDSLVVPPESAQGADAFRGRAEATFVDLPSRYQVRGRL